MKIKRPIKEKYLPGVGDIAFGTQSGDPYLICTVGNFHYSVVNLAGAEMKTIRYDSIDELVKDWGFEEFVPAEQVELLFKD
jgi:hypothetical protein